MKHNWYLTTMVAILTASLVGAFALHKVDRLQHERNSLRLELNEICKCAAVIGTENASLRNDIQDERKVCANLAGIIFPRSDSCYPATLQWGDGQRIEIPYNPWQKDGLFWLDAARFGFASGETCFLPIPNTATSYQLSRSVVGPLCSVFGSSADADDVFVGPIERMKIDDNGIRFNGVYPPAFHVSWPD